MNISEFDFHLPQELIAKKPIYPRGSSRLLHLSNNGMITDLQFSEISKLFKKGDLLILNNSKVIPSYFKGVVKSGKYTGKVITIYLNATVAENVWSAYARPGKHISVGEEVVLNEDLPAKIISKDLSTGEFKLQFRISGENLIKRIKELGDMPIPPYLKREPESDDFEDYQTFYAEKYGSVAAPTAGLHFTDEIIKKIKEVGVDIAWLTLHVGSGTFLPVKTEEVEDHHMHSERFTIPEVTAEKVNNALKERRRIIAVGSTSIRALESVAGENGKITAQTSDTNIFIKPGFKFKAVDCLITNFHTPKSTLLILISAFSGIDEVRKAYEHAVKSKYRFFSFGDSCWMDRSSKGFSL